MARLPNQDELRTCSCCSGAASAAVKLETEDPLDDELGRLNKKFKTVAPHQQDAMCNLLDELSPLGLHLRKSPSLVDLIQMRLSQANSSAASCGSTLRAWEVEGRKN
ncbi:hypothetical protein C4D60_Mb06t05220 [Musa balbisiana]|uniref:Uncharacterized protein n=1 Tax=Musa balbisiana TaxID=52838 RepID=A0A4S8IM21_MUSBA|nr:hypothetical protein C4D60_Mb06t05220 [Musa balbisiana]